MLNIRPIHHTSNRAKVETFHNKYIESGLEVYFKTFEFLVFNSFYNRYTWNWPIKCYCSWFSLLAVNIMHGD